MQGAEQQHPYIVMHVAIDAQSLCADSLKIGLVLGQAGIKQRQDRIGTRQIARREKARSLPGQLKRQCGQIADRRERQDTAIVLQCGDRGRRRLILDTQRIENIGPELTQQPLLVFGVSRMGDLGHSAIQLFRRDLAVALEQHPDLVAQGQVNHADRREGDAKGRGTPQRKPVDERGIKPQKQSHPKAIKQNAVGPIRQVEQPVARYCQGNTGVDDQEKQKCSALFDHRGQPHKRRQD